MDAEIRARLSIVPPAGGTNLFAFIKGCTNLARAERITVDGKVYFRLFGQTPNFHLNLPSGQPVYLFDDSGVMVEWVADLGDSSHYSEKWMRASNVTALNVQEIRKMITEKAGK